MIFAPYIFADLLPAGLIMAAISDLRSMIIPNRLCLILAACFFPAALCAQLSLEQWMQCLGMGGLGLVAGMLMFALRLMGGGDAKLIAATSLWFGFSGFMSFLVYTALAGGAFTLLLLGCRHIASVYALPLKGWIERLMKPKGDIPYGVAICIGGILAIPHGPMALFFGFSTT